jgi:hypothetical protein
MRFCFLMTVLALSSGITMSSHAAANSYAIPVVNLPEISDASEYVTNNLSPQLIDTFRKNDLVVFGSIGRVEFAEKYVCFVILGPTKNVPPDRNPRIPAVMSAGFARTVKTDANKESCLATAFRKAVENLNEDTPVSILKDVDRVLPHGGNLMSEIANDTMRWLNSRSLSEAGKRAVFAIMDDYPINNLFDYRQVQTYVSTYSAKFENGDKVCVAIAGLGARTPEGREPRSLGYSHSAGFIMSNGDECETSAATLAVKRLFNQPWTNAGIFKDFARTREDGLSLPDLRVVEAKRKVQLAEQKRSEKAANKTQALVAARNVKSTQRNYLSCRNQCTNGSCLRTFPDGKTERWQAPRTFDAMSGDWKWDTSSCGG